jgi:hypothetical protein
MLNIIMLNVVAPCTHALIQHFQHTQTYFSIAVSYKRKRLIKSTPRTTFIKRFYTHFRTKLEYLLHLVGKACQGQTLAYHEN